MEILMDYFFWILLVATIVFIYLYKRITKRPDALTSKFISFLKIDRSSETLIEPIRQALINSGFRKVGFDESENRLYAQTKVSMSSWTEYIEVMVIKEELTTKLKFKSICALPTQIFDWGKNKRNFKKFERELIKLMPTQPIRNAD